MRGKGVRKRQSTAKLTAQVEKKRRSTAKVGEIQTEPMPCPERVVLASSSTDDAPTGTCTIDFASLLPNQNYLGCGGIERPNLTTSRARSTPDMDLGSSTEGAVALHSSVNESGFITSNNPYLGTSPQNQPIGQYIEPMRCITDDLSVHIPASLRKQIERGDYVNLALMLKGAVELDEFANGGALRLSADGVLESRPSNCKDKIPNIEKWTDAFIVFMSVFIKVNPSKANEMLQYMSLIRECAHRQGGYAWRTYDEQFRVRQASNPAPWSSINQDLWLRCMSLRDTTPQVVHTPHGVNRTKCLDFNQGRCHWSNCKFSHSCSNCGLGHARIYCQNANKPIDGNSNQFQFKSDGFRTRGNNSFRFRRGGFRGAGSPRNGASGKSQQ